MAKRKKTKEQKILAEKRRQIQSLVEEKYSYSVEASPEAPTRVDAPLSSIREPEKGVSKINPSLYFMHDFKKTIIVTAIIIVIQVLLHNFIK